MRFNAVSAEELLDKQVVKSGVYSYEVKDASETTSQAGNDTIRLEISVNVNGQFKIIPDYLVGVGRGLVKLRQICQVCKLMDKYERGVLSHEDLLGHSGKLRLGVESDRSKRFPPKNVIVDYLS